MELSRGSVLGDEQWHEAVRALHRGLADSSFRSLSRVPTTRNLLALPFEPRNLWGFWTGGSRRLLEPTAWPAFYRAMQRWRDPLSERCFGFFVLNEPMARDHVAAMLAHLPGAPDIDALCQAGVADVKPDQRVRSRLRFLPSGDLLLVADAFADTRDRSLSDFVYIGRDSLYLADQLRRDAARARPARALDLCCGTGVQGLCVARHAGHVDGADLNPRAVGYANLNAALNGLADSARFYVTDLADGLTGPYDLVVANPPYILMSAEEAAHNRDGHGGGKLGLDIPCRIIAELDRLLSPTGQALMVCTSPVVGGESSLPGLMAEILASTGLGATLREVRRFVDRRRWALHQERAVSHVIYYYVRVARELPAGVRVEPMPLPSRAVYAAYVTLANRLYALRA